MPYLLGVDEAGYGPNLGPLVISVSVWRLTSADVREDLYQLLGDTFSHDGVSVEERDRISIADSKLLYRPGGGLAMLERGVLGMLAAQGHSPRSLREVWRALVSGFSFDDAPPWLSKYDEDAPSAVASDLVQHLAQSIQSTMTRAGASCLHIASTTIFPQRFNELLAHHQSKGSLLTHQTLQLLSHVMQTLDDEPIFILCDKHGGRSRYAPSLQEMFPEYLVEIYGESREESVYRWGPASRRVEARFSARGERFLPSALASMTSKYLRELAMKALNAFWIDQVPDLKPTAGYPVDARRFKKEIAAAQERLGIADAVLWREK